MPENNIALAATEQELTELINESKILLKITAESLLKARDKYSQLKVCMRSEKGVDTDKLREAQNNLMEQIKLRQNAIKSHEYIINSLDSRISFIDVDQKFENEPADLISTQQEDCFMELMEYDDEVTNNNDIDKTKESKIGEDPAEITSKVHKMQTVESIKEYMDHQNNLISSSRGVNIKQENKMKKRSTIFDSDSEKENDEEIVNVNRKNANFKRNNFIIDSSDDDECKENVSKTENLETAAVEEVSIVKKRKIKKDADGIFDISVTDESDDDDLGETVIVRDESDISNDVEIIDEVMKIDDFDFVEPGKQPPKPMRFAKDVDDDMSGIEKKYNPHPKKTSGKKIKHYGLYDEDEYSGDSSDMESDCSDDSDNCVDNCYKDLKKFASTDKEIDKMAQKYVPGYANSNMPSTSGNYHASTASKSFTVGNLKDIQNQLDARPNEDVLDDAPDFLNVTLMRHQLHALKFMRWREDQKMKGGILADDMGLGKTLITISLIMKQNQIRSFQNYGEQYNRESWDSIGRRLVNGGTLIICPASLVRQWESEIDKMVMSGHLSCYLFHGGKRTQSVKELSKYDVVVTSYHTITSEYSETPTRRGICYRIKFQRIVLDEGHIIRNPKTSFANSVWDLAADSRWILSGTPIQNKEFDLFAVIKFLRCSPFDSLEYWKEHVPAPRKGRAYQPSSKLQTLLKSILLRRTKAQLEEAGHIDRLPPKNLIEIKFQLDEKERNIYNRLMTYSKSVFANFLAQQKDKQGSYIYNDYNLGSNIDETFRTFFRKYNRKEEYVHGSRILVLLLRLRQATCHASLIKAMVDEADLEVGILDHNHAHNVNDDDEEMGPQYDILRKLVQDKAQPNSEAFDSQEDFWNIENEVFDTNRPSSKMIKMMEILDDVVKFKNKAIIVSQWVVHLNIVKRMLVSRNIRYCEFTGQVQVSKRNEIVNNFNDPSSGIEVMLLSLTCGGVGLNLVGANVMFIMDLHWNPQLEKQGQDRIYRFGQKKEVKIYKFICEDTIEERVLELQMGKLEIADSLLTGSRMTAANKLSLNDLMALFGLNQPAKPRPTVAPIATAGNVGV